MPDPGVSFQDGDLGTLTPQQAYHAHLLKPDKKLAPSSIITLNHALWQGDVEAFLSNR